MSQVFTNFFVIFQTGEHVSLIPCGINTAGGEAEETKDEGKSSNLISSLLFKSTDDGDPAADDWDPFDESDNESDSALAVPVTSSHTLSSTAAAFPKTLRTRW